jgi:hypothetical protein
MAGIAAAFHCCLFGGSISPANALGDTEAQNRAVAIAGSVSGSVEVVIRDTLGGVGRDQYYTVYLKETHSSRQYLLHHLRLDDSRRGSGDVERAQRCSVGCFFRFSP